MGDHEFIKRLLAEGLRRKGVDTPAKYFVYSNVDDNLYHDTDGVYADPVDVNIILENYPQVEVLAHADEWFDEDTSITPLQVYIAEYGNVRPKINDRLQFKIDFTPDTVYDFLIVSTKVINMYGMLWSCTCTPYRPDAVRLPNVTTEATEEVDENFKLLQIPRSDKR